MGRGKIYHGFQNPRVKIKTQNPKSKPKTQNQNPKSSAKTRLISWVFKTQNHEPSLEMGLWGWVLGFQMKIKTQNPKSKPKNKRKITLNLMGFGKSPRSIGQDYSALWGQWIRTERSEVVRGAWRSHATV